MAKIPNKVKKQIHTYINRVREEWPISSVVLFGSYAQGKGRRDSDIDLAIISPRFKPVPSLKTLERLQALKWSYGPDIEPLAFNEKEFIKAGPLDFAGGVVKKDGVVVYRKKQFLL